MAFEKDINWIERSKTLRPYRDGSTLLIMGAAMLLTLILIVVLSVATAQASDDERPDWQNQNTPQKLYENFMAWKNYTDELDAAGVLAEEPSVDELILNTGEAYAISMDFIQHINSNAFPTGSCAIDFFLNFEDIVQNYANFYGGLHYQLTAMDTMAMDPFFWLDEAAMAEEWMVQSTSAKCWNKLDA